jgi:hypothetical protein
MSEARRGLPTTRFTDASTPIKGSNGRRARCNRGKPRDPQLAICNTRPAAEASQLEFCARGGPKGSIVALLR